MNIVLPIVLLSFVVIASISLFQAYQGLFSSFVMFVLTAVSAAVAMDYAEPLGWSLGKWHPDHLSFVILFILLIVLGSLAKSIMSTNRYARLAIGAAAVVLLILAGSRTRIEPGTATGNSYGQAITLIGLFVITLLSLRAIFDNVVLGNMTFPWQVERAGGALLGFFTGLIVMGMALISWQLMPFGPGLFSSGYQDFYGLTPRIEKRPADMPASQWNRRSRYSVIDLGVSPPAEESWASYNRYDEQMKLQAAPFPYADGFTLGLLKALGQGSLGVTDAEKGFAYLHQDLLLEAWANRNGINAASRQAAPAKSVLQAQWQQSEDSQADQITGLLNLTLDRQAADEDGVLRFKGLQVRLVGESGKSYWPSGIDLDSIPFWKLQGDLSGLAIPGENGEAGYLQYKPGYHLWAKDQKKRTKIRREVRGCQNGRFWWQLQMLGEQADMQFLPASLGMVHKPAKNQNTTVGLMFSIDPQDKPDYVVFKRTAFKKVTRVKPQEEAPSAPQANGVAVDRPAKTESNSSTDSEPLQ